MPETGPGLEVGSSDLPAVHRCEPRPRCHSVQKKRCWSLSIAVLVHWVTCLLPTQGTDPVSFSATGALLRYAS
jgi:hypothetical protein